MNLVLVLAGLGDDGNLERLLAEIGSRYAEFTGEDAEVMVVLLTDTLARAEKSNWPFVVLSDGKGRVRRVFSVGDQDGIVRPAVIVADQYGEIYAEFRSVEGQHRPETDEILQWLFLINSQCPECGVSDWPK